MERIGVLGGTFDPPHYGHLRAAELVREAAGLAKVVFMPAAVPPHKSGPRVTEAEHRAEMLKAALTGEEGFELSRMELARGGPSYTIETLDRLAKEAPDPLWFFITGMDAFLEIRTWKSWEELVERFSFIVHERPGLPGEDRALERVRDILPEKLHRRVLELTEPSSLRDARSPVIGLFRGKMLDISSTEVRRLVREKRSIRFLLPDSVADYIDEHRLYQEGT